MRYVVVFTLLSLKLTALVLTLVAGFTLALVVGKIWGIESAKKALSKNKD
jgi:hypothetical protein